MNSRRYDVVPHSLVILLGLMCSSSSAQSLLWSELDDSIRAAALSGSDVATVVSRQLWVVPDVAFDSSNRKLYWTDFRRQTINRANPDGTAREVVIHTPTILPHGLALDASSGLIYWTSGETDYSNAAVYRSRLDGSEAEQLVASSDCGGFGDIVVHTPGDRLYWTTSCAGGCGFVMASRTDGSDVMELIATGYEPAGLAIDFSGSKLYWIEYAYSVTEARLVRADLDGSNVRVVRTFHHGEAWPTSLAVDEPLRKLLWTARSLVQRAELDGSDVETVARVVDQAGELDLNAISFDPLDRTVYFRNAGTYSDGPYKIQRTRTVDGIVEDVLATVVEDPPALVVDKLRGQLYWTNGSPGVANANYGALPIYRSTLAGANPQALPLKTMWPGALAWNPMSERLYWHDRYDGMIRRGKLDGSEVEELIATGCEAAALALDNSTGELYWTDPCSYSVRRADPSFKRFENLIPRDTSLHSASGLAIDRACDKFYWISGRTIRNARLDGSDAEVLIEVSGFTPMGLALDRSAGTLYWSAWTWYPAFDGRIHHADLNGSNLEEFHAEAVGTPLGLAVNPCPPRAALDWAANAEYVACMSGPTAFRQGECVCSDWSDDERVDLADFALLQRYFAQ